MPRACKIAAIALLLLPAAGGSPAFAARHPYVEGDKVVFQLPDLDGEMIPSSDQRFEGKVVLIDLWATWCPPCRTEIPTLIDLQEKYGQKGLVIVGIAFEDGDDDATRRAKLEQFATGEGLNYLVLDGGRPEDMHSAVPTVRRLKGLPVEILVDRTGRVASIRNGYGYSKKWADRLRSEIETLLNDENE